MKREDDMQEALSRGLMGVSDRVAPGIDPQGKGKKGDKPQKRPGSAPPGGGKASGGKKQGEKQISCYAFQTFDGTSEAAARATPSPCC